MSPRISRRPQKTVQGRIVYDRPKHAFTYSRAIHILGKVDWRQETAEDLNRSVEEIERIYLNVLTTVLESGGMNGAVLNRIGGFIISILTGIRGRMFEGLEWVWNFIRDSIIANL